MLVEIIRKIAEETQEELQSYRHRPSSVGKCIRALVYHASKVPPKPFPGRAILVFDDSSWHEELTADWIQKSAYQLHSRQMKIDIFKVNSKTVSGSIDGILQDPLGREYLWEHKALNHFGFERILRDPKEAHDYFWQTSLYLYGLQQIQPDIEQAVLHIKNKNTANYNEYILTPSTGWAEVAIHTLAGTQKGALVLTITNPIEDAQTKFTLVDTHMEAETLPNRPYIYDDWRCDYCRWGGVCWEGYENELNESADAVNLYECLEPVTVGEIIGYRAVLNQINELNKRKVELNERILNALAAKDIRGGSLPNEGIIVGRVVRHTKEHLVKESMSEILSVKCVGNRKKEKDNARNI